MGGGSGLGQGALGQSVGQSAAGQSAEQSAMGGGQGQSGLGLEDSGDTTAFPMVAFKI